MKVVDGLFCGLFVFAALLQANDPDPLVWIAGYLVAAVLAGGAAAGRSWPMANLVASLLFAAWFLTLAPSLVTAESAAFSEFRMTRAHHEEPREAVGIGLCAGWCAGMAWRAASRRAD